MARWLTCVRSSFESPFAVVTGIAGIRATVYDYDELNANGKKNAWKFCERQIFIILRRTFHS